MYELLKNKSAFLIGSKFYKSDNSSQQGPGSSDDEPDFNIYINDYPYYYNQSH